MNFFRKPLLLIGIASALIVSCSKNNNPQKPLPTIPNDVVIKWNEVTFETMGGPAFQHSLFAARLNALVHIAMHDAINATKPEYEQYAFKSTVSNADPIAAAASAAHTILVANFPNQKTMLDSVLLVSTTHNIDEQIKANGIEAGKQAANALLAIRANDGADADPIGLIEPSTVPGVYNVVPPFTFVFAPTWKTMKTFGITRHDQFRSAPPPALTSQVYTKDFNEVKQVGIANSTTRTADQTFYAKFWYEFSEIGWNRITRVISKNKNADLFETARAFALVNMALVDSYIAGWDSKYHYNFWRPFTAIRAAEADGNDQTVDDTNWEPAETTPPVQDYPSTHSALGNAASKVLISIFGNNSPFTMSSFTVVPGGSLRSFTTLSQAANENADSRVMAGIHFRFSCEAGQQLGDKIGEFIVANNLKKLP